MLSFSQAPGMIEYSAGSFIDLEIFTTNKLLKLLRCLCCWYFSLMDWSLDRHPVKYNIIYDGYHKFIICNGTNGVTCFDCRVAICSNFNFHCSSRVILKRFVNMQVFILQVTLCIMGFASEWKVTFFFLFQYCDLHNIIFGTF